MKIAVGTTSEQKLEYLQQVIDEIGIRAELIPVEVLSQVSEQPMTETETESGSKNRAQNALSARPDADFAIGVEVGYHKNVQAMYEMFSCATIVDANSFMETCYSSKFLLPEFHQKILEEKKYLGEHVREYKKEIDEPVTNYVREFIRGRKPLIVEASRNILLEYFVFAGQPMEKGM